MIGNRHIQDKIVQCIKPKNKTKIIRIYSCCNPLCDNALELHPREWNSRNRTDKIYYVGCCRSCSHCDYVKTTLRGQINIFRTNEGQQKVRNTIKERYGEDNIRKTEYGKQKIKEGNLRSHGFENPQQNPEIKAKTFATTKDRYDLCGWANKKIMFETNNIRYGENYYFSSKQGRMDLQGFIVRNGEIDGPRLYKEYCRKKGVGQLLESKIQKWGFEEGVRRYEAWVSAATNYFERLLKKYSYEEAKMIYEKFINLRTTNSLKKQGQKSSLNRKIKDALVYMAVEFEEEFMVRKETLGGRYLFDFYLPKQKCVIEVNGSYWHADPLLYEADQLIKYPAGKVMKAQEVWKRDEIKALHVPSNLRLVLIWEKEIQSIKTNEDLAKLILEKIKYV